MTLNQVHKSMLRTLLVGSLAIGSSMSFGQRSWAQESTSSQVPTVDIAQQPSPEATADQLNHARDLSNAFKSAANKLLPSVVTVLAKLEGSTSTLENLELLSTEEIYPGIGSGVILSDKGLIVTNHHVVAKATEVRVRMFNGSEFKASNIRSDASADLAILTIDSPDPLTPAKIADSDAIAVGDWVLAIGSPFSFDQTVSVGIISGKARVLRELVAGQLLQTDASINPGNSGGALANLDGELVGINTAIASRSGASQGVGFAIPSNRMKWIVSELEENGKVRRSYIGLRAEPISFDLAKDSGIPIQGGVYVSAVTRGGPADKAGIQLGDILLSLAQQKIHTPSEFAEIVEQLPVDQPQPIELVRQKERMTLQVTLAPAPEKKR
jgi:serine protease Do